MKELMGEGVGLRKFTEYGAASRRNVTIRSNGILFISKAVIDEFKADDSEYSIIFIDENEYLLGIKFVEEKPSDNYRKLNKEKSGVLLDISPALRFLRIGNLEKKFTTGFKKKYGMLVFSVEELINR